MKTITIKTDERFFDYVTNLAARLGLSKSELIKRAIREYEQNLYKKSLQKKIEKASLRVRKSLQEDMTLWDTTAGDGLDAEAG